MPFAFDKDQTLQAITPSQQKFIEKYCVASL